MQPTQNSTLADSTPCLPRFTWLRNLLLTHLMRSLTIIERDIFVQNPLSLILASQQKTLQRLPSRCPEQAFHDAVHVRRFHSGSDGYEIVGQIIKREHQSIAMNQIGSGDYGWFTMKFWSG